MGFFFPVVVGFVSVFFFFFLLNYCTGVMCKPSTLPLNHESAQSQRLGCRGRERADRATSISGTVFPPDLLPLRSRAESGEHGAGAQGPARGRPGGIPARSLWDGSGGKGSLFSHQAAARLLVAGEAAVGPHEPCAAAPLPSVSERKSISVTKIRYCVFFFFFS